MGVVGVRIRNSFNEGQQLHSPQSMKSLDESGGTSATVDSMDSDGHDGFPKPLSKPDCEPDISGSANIAQKIVHPDPFDGHKGPATRPPIVISEDDGDVPHQELEHAPETYFHASLIKDSLEVQKHHKANDDELHEENPHLEDFLIPHHSVHIEDQPQTDEKPKERCTHGILHKEEASPDPLDQLKPKRKVHFGKVLVRDYDMVLGDHPCCSYGPPITIAWDYLEYEPLDVNEYEFHHPPRRNLREMGLNYYARKRILSQAGFTEVDIKLSTKEVNRQKMNRSLTRSISSYYPLLKAEAAVESACRKFKRLIKDDHWKEQKSLYVNKRRSAAF